MARELGLLPGAGAAGPQAAATVADSPQKIEETTAAGKHRAELTLAKVRQNQIVAEAKAASDLADEALKVLTDFENRLAELLRGEEGKAIGASPELTSQFIALSETERPARSDVERYRTSIADLMKPLEASFKNPLDATLPPENLLAELEVLKDRAGEARDSYRAAREQLDDLASRAKVSGQTGELALKEAVSRYRSEEARKETERVEAERTKAREEAAAALAAQEAGRLRAMAAKELELKKAEMQAELARKDQERKRRLAEDPAIQAKFRPLLAKGRWLFEQGSFSKISAPASYSILLKQGYLRSYEGFARAMAGWTNFPRSFSPGDGYYTEFSDRPRHRMPETEAEWVEMKGLFETFKELAPTWVEMGLLSK